MTPRDEAIEAVKENPRYLIRKRGAWYRHDSRGYTGSAILAGRYTLDEAISITHPNGKDGPRDGMSYCHEDALIDEEWAAYDALRAALDAAEARLRDAVEACAKIVDRRVQVIVDENGSWEPDTNVTNLPEWAETACEELEAIVAAIRAGKGAA